MPTTLEDLSRLLDSNPSPTEFARQHEVFAAGIHDLKERLANLEHANLEAMHRLSLLETRLADAEIRTAGYAKDRDEFRKRVDAVEKVPVASAEKLDAIEKRLRQVEGAVGSKNFKAPASNVETLRAPTMTETLNPFHKTEPAEPAKTPVPA
jgi:hypothetical protein